MGGHALLVPIPAVALVLVLTLTLPAAGEPAAGATSATVAVQGGPCRVPVGSAHVTWSTGGGAGPWGCKAQGMFTFSVSSAECTPSACIVTVSTQAEGRWWAPREDANALAVSPAGGAAASYTALEATVSSYGEAPSWTDICLVFEQGFSATCPHRRPHAAYVVPNGCAALSPRIEVRGYAPLGTLQVRANNGGVATETLVVCRDPGGAPSLSLR